MTTMQWDPPDKGEWRGLHDHFPRAMVPENEAILADGMTTGEAVWIERYGFPVRTIEPRFVHGRVFIAPVPLAGPRSDRMPPPFAMKLAIAVVPSFRRRAKAAARTVVDRPWLAEAAGWYDGERDEWVARNEALDAIDPSTLDDPALVTHLVEVRRQASEGYRTHFRLHGCDLIPTGMLLVRAIDWGLDPVAVAGLLAGHSPASRGDEEQPRWCLVTGYGLDDLTAGELPALPKADGRAKATVDTEVESALRSAVPVDDRDEWDQLLTDARFTYGVRDSNGLLTAAWPMGLLRRAMLEVGRRLAGTGALAEVGHAVELTVAELGDALLGRPAPTAAEAAARLAHRRSLSGEPAPTQLGPTQHLPVDAMPPAMRTLTRALLGVRDLGVTSGEDRKPLHGVAVGGGSVVGRACVAADPAEALARFEPGDIVVTAGTCPAWNAILALAGGVVTEEGGPLSHAAVIARELGLPALIGCTGAMTEIPDGAAVELDAVTGGVRVL